MVSGAREEEQDRGLQEKADQARATVKSGGGSSNRSGGRCSLDKKVPMNQ
jgi:hypothetical protein